MIFWKRVKQAINDLWYPRSVTVGKPVETQELANRIARESTVSPADTHAVLRALPNIMADFMKESRAVHFEGLGWFRYTTGLVPLHHRFGRQRRCHERGSEQRPDYRPACAVHSRPYP